MSARVRLRVDPIVCDGRGLCAEILPELIVLDDWGFPVIGASSVPEDLREEVGEAIRLCPRLALRLEPVVPRAGTNAPGAPGLTGERRSGHTYSHE